MGNEKHMISADALKKSIADVKKCFRSDNNDYMTGYISALSVVEGMIAYLISPEPPIDEKEESGLVEE